MCMTCMMDPWCFGKVFPGFNLIRARREYFDEIAVKDWALQQCNDPSLVWSTTPYLYDDEDVFDEHYNRFVEETLCSLSLGYAIIAAFKQVNPSFKLKRLYVKYGDYQKRDPIMQLYIYLADFIRNSEPSAGEFAFGDNGFKFDYDYNPKLP